jgi:hypothetical protein
MECFGCAPLARPSLHGRRRTRKLFAPPACTRPRGPRIRNLSYGMSARTRAEHEPHRPDAHVQLALVKCEQCRDDTFAARTQPARLLDNDPLDWERLLQTRLDGRQGSTGDLSAIRPLGARNSRGWLQNRSAWSVCANPAKTLATVCVSERILRARASTVLITITVNPLQPH